MSDELALLTAILANPDEDTPRLVFADWLDENDSPDSAGRANGSLGAGSGSRAARAEFIRVQVEITRQPERHPYPSKYRTRLTRFRELFAAHSKEWLGVVGVPLPRAIFRRGFVEEIRATADELLNIGDAALSREMLSHVEVTASHDRNPDTDEGPIGDAVLRRLAEWPIRGRLRHLRLTALTLTPPAVRALVTSPAAAGLRSLDLSGCGFPAEPVRAVVEAARLPELTDLWLSYWPR